MSIQGFPHTMQELSNRMKSERERLESQRELMAEERSRYFHNDDEPIPEHIIGELRRHAKREDRIVQIWAWLFAILVVGALFGLCIWLLPAMLTIGISIAMMLAASVGLGIVWHDRRKYPSGGTL